MARFVSAEQGEPLMRRQIAKIRMRNFSSEHSTVSKSGRSSSSC
jgi:hypothetical protein